MATREKGAPGLSTSAASIGSGAELLLVNLGRFTVLSFGGWSTTPCRSWAPAFATLAAMMGIIELTADGGSGS